MRRRAPSKFDERMWRTYLEHSATPSQPFAMPAPKFHPGQQVISYGFAPYTVERVYQGEDGWMYDLREVLSEKLLKLTTRQLVTGVPEKYVHERL